jgi:hypothetical protein
MLLLSFELVNDATIKLVDRIEVSARIEDWSRTLGRVQPPRRWTQARCIASGHRIRQVACLRAAPVHATRGLCSPYASTQS